MIDYGKFAILGALVVIVFGSGWYLGNSRYVAYKAEVEALGKAQEEKVKSIRTQQELVTKGIEKEYEAKLALIRNYYSNGVRQPSSDTLSKYGVSTKRFDAAADYNILAGQCAETTAQTIALQDWVKAQAGIK